MIISKKAFVHVEQRPFKILEQAIILRVLRNAFCICS